MQVTSENNQVKFTLPDDSQRAYPQGTTGLGIAASIGKKLAKDAVAIRVDGELKDLTLPLEQDAEIELITRESGVGLEILRHDAAHVMAEAVKELYPETQVTIGPAIENGFYYDFYREESFTPEDLEKIEKKMRQIVGRNEVVTREEWTRNDAVKFFKDQGEEFKAELIAAIPEDQQITCYRQGEFVDLCRGPHLPSTGKLGTAFKLMKLAGAYWRGDSNNPMLQRIYGTAWANEKQLKAYLHQLEEAEKRDHRKLGREMELFHMQDEAPGSVFWHPKGWQIYRTLQNYIRKRTLERGYQEINTPMLVDRTLWEQSGHWEKFQEHMFALETEHGRHFALKPMSCPCHVEVFRQGMKSYRDLPLRLAEFGCCHRNEPSGALHGLMRVRVMTQDDGHVFCTPEQILDETKSFCALLLAVYKDFGFEDVRVRFSDRPETRAGSDDTWDRAEKALREATESAGLEYDVNPGEGAFYGPKLEFVLRDAIGRSWQCGTLQLDFVLPERLKATYIGEDGQKHFPVMLHRAIYGSLERFLGMLIEHYAGHFPLWLAPLQVVVAPITNDFDEYAQEVANRLQSEGLRVETDLRNEKIGYKIRELSHQKVPVILAVGGREMQARTVAVRRLGSKNQEIISLGQVVSDLKNEALGPLDTML
ncbi:MAG: threonine--tRNA ligase [Pseudomonadota bacterium]